MSARLAIPPSIRRPTVPLALALAIALGVAALALTLAPGPGAIGLPAKAFAALALVASAAALVLYRPVLFPMLAFMAAIPFDTMLQTGGGTITKFLGIATLVVTLLVLLDRRRTVTPPLAVAGWFAFLAWSVASLMWAGNPAFGMANLVQVIQLFVMFTFFSMLRVKFDEMRWIVLVVVASGIACSLYGVYMYFSGHIQHEDAVSQRLSIDLARGTYINADHFAGALVFPMAIALVAFLRLQSWHKAAAAGAFLALLAGVLVSATRGSIVALLVMAVYFAIVERNRIQLIVVAAIGFVVSLFIPSVWARFSDPGQGDLGGRSGIWHVAFRAFRHHWLAGWGTGNFRLAYGSEYLNVFQRGFYHAWAEDSHNIIASTSVELGVVGLALLFVAWYWQFRVTACIPRSEQYGAIRSAVEAGTIGVFIVALTVDVLWYKYLWLVFFVGVLARNAWIRRVPGAQQPS